MVVEWRLGGGAESSYDRRRLRRDYRRQRCGDVILIGAMRPKARVKEGKCLGEGNSAIADRSGRSRDCETVARQRGPGQLQEGKGQQEDEGEKRMAVHRGSIPAAIFSVAVSGVNVNEH